MVWDEGPRTALCSVQRVLALKHTANLWIEMLKQVQMTRRAGYRLQGMGPREENRQSIQGFNATEEVVRAAVCGSPSLCHPGLDPGSVLRTNNLDA